MAQAHPPASQNRSHGFTIIEILIVLAIAGLILAIVFLVVPTVQRSARNHTRKAAVDYTAAALTEYQSENGHYPLTATGDSRAAFTNELKNEGPTKIYDILYGTTGLSHEYPYNTTDGPYGALDQIVIIPSHRCNRNAAPGDIDYPVEATVLGDSNYGVYATYTVLEAARDVPHVYCVDSEH